MPRTRIKIIVQTPQESYPKFEDKVQKFMDSLDSINPAMPIVTGNGNLLVATVIWSENTKEEFDRESEWANLRKGSIYENDK